MAIISKEQMKVFSKASVESFEIRMNAHLTRFFPEKCRALGEKGTLETIRHGTKRAAFYCITAERDVCKYIDFMFTFGRDFDRDRKLPWAAEILGGDADLESSERVERLYAGAEKHLANAGPVPGNRMA